MKIVIDTAVVISAFFFGGRPRQVLDAVMRGKAAAYAAREIVEEYEAVVAKMKAETPAPLRPNLLLPFTSRLHIVEPKPHKKLCRTPGDDKFLACALTANAFYIINAGKKISPLAPFRPFKTMTVDGFCQLLTLCK